MKSRVIIFSIIFGVLLVSLTCSNEVVKPIKTEAELGQKLFFDPILSKDSSISCASCHNPDFAFADNIPLSKGVGDSVGTRNTPSVMNMAMRPYFFYDGRAATLEAQASGPVENPLEMHLAFSEAVSRIANNEEYKVLFKRIYHSKPDSISITNAIAEFQRTLESNGSAPHDRWVRDEGNFLTESQLRGREIFLEKGKCFDCHFGPDFTGDEFRNIGLYDGKVLVDKGRFDVTKDTSDLGKFKTPGLRNVALTAPYMHNGMFATLEEVIDFYSNPYDFVEEPINIDTLMIEPLHLNDEEKQDLVNFLHSLTDETFDFEIE